MPLNKGIKSNKYAFEKWLVDFTACGQQLPVKFAKADGFELLGFYRKLRSVYKYIFRLWIPTNSYFRIGALITKFSCWCCGALSGGVILAHRRKAGSLAREKGGNWTPRGGFVIFNLTA